MRPCNLPRLIASRPLQLLGRSLFRPCITLDKRRTGSTMSPASSSRTSSSSFNSSSSHSQRSSSSSATTPPNPKPETQQIKRITVFGAGLMGAGIAQVGAMNGYQVVLSDVTDTALQNGLAIIKKSLGRTSKKMLSSSVVAAAAAISAASSDSQTKTFDAEAWERGVLGSIELETDA